MSGLLVSKYHSDELICLGVNLTNQIIVKKSAQTDNVEHAKSEDK